MNEEESISTFAIILFQLCERIISPFEMFLEEDIWSVYFFPLPFAYFLIIAEVQLLCLLCFFQQCSSSVALAVWETEKNQG